MGRNDFPDIDSYHSSYNNPTLVSPLSMYELPFAQTMETMQDITLYNRFLANSVKRFRSSITYKVYKECLHSLGLNVCQIHGNINTTMATIEMHHNMITVYDIAYIITEHILRTCGKVTSFDVIEELKRVHRENKVQLVMISVTPHQANHNTTELILPPNMCVGRWWEFLEEFQLGISQEIAFKIIGYIKKNIDDGFYGTDTKILELHDKVLSWAKYNSICR